MFCEVRGWGCHVFYGDPKGDVPRVEGGGVTFLKGIQKGEGGQKNPVNRNENLQTPLLIKNDTSLKLRCKWIVDSLLRVDFLQCDGLFPLFTEH